MSSSNCFSERLLMVEKSRGSSSQQTDFHVAALEACGLVCSFFDFSSKIKHEQLYPISSRTISKATCSIGVKFWTGSGSRAKLSMLLLSFKRFSPTLSNFYDTMTSDNNRAEAIEKKTNARA